MCWEGGFFPEFWKSPMLQSRPFDNLGSTTVSTMLDLKRNVSRLLVRDHVNLQLLLEWGPNIWGIR